MKRDRCRPVLLALLLGAAPTALRAQRPAAPPPVAAQVAAALAPLPEQFRATAAVLGYRAPGVGLSPLRPGDGAFVCLADDPSDDRFHVACYHRSLEPFMARGRELRAQGRGAQVDSVRNAEIVAGVLPMPEVPAALYSLTGPPESMDASSGAVEGARPLFVIYVPFATAESTGLPSAPVHNAPWIMFPGTPKAHIMFVPEMR